MRAAARPRSSARSCGRAQRGEPVPAEAVHGGGDRGRLAERVRDRRLGGGQRGLRQGLDQVHPAARPGAGPRPARPRRGRWPAGQARSVAAGPGAGRPPRPAAPAPRRRRPPRRRARGCVSVSSATPAAVRYGLTWMPNSVSAREVAACQSAGAGSGSGRSSISGRAAPGRGAGIERRAGTRPAAAAPPRPARPGRRPRRAGQAPGASRRSSRGPARRVTGSCGCRPSRAAARSNSAPHGPNRSSPNRKCVSPAVPTCSALATRRTAGDVALQPDPAVPVGDGPLDVRVHGGQVPHGDLDVGRLEPRMPRVGGGERLVDEVAERGRQVGADRARPGRSSGRG